MRIGAVGKFRHSFNFREKKSGALEISEAEGKVSFKGLHDSSCKQGAHTNK